MEYPDLAGQNPRIGQRDIASRSLKAQNSAVLFGNKRDGFLQIDYINKRIIVNDGTNDRVLFGFQKDGF